MIFTENIINFIKNNWNANFLDEKFLERLTELFISELEIEKYLEKIYQKDISTNTLGFYKENKKVICFSWNIILRDIKFLNENNNFSNKSDIESYMFYLLILHEVLHAKEQKIMEEESTLSRILKDSCQVRKGDFNLSYPQKICIGNKKKGVKLYREYHDLFPVERYSNTISGYTMFNIYNEMYPKNIENIAFFKSILEKKLMKDYSDENNPVKLFYKLINKLEIYEELSFKEYSSREKCLYGMPLSEEILNKEKSLILKD